MSKTSMTESDIGKSIMEALKKASGSAGTTLEDIKQHLTSKQDKVPDMESIKSWLDSAVEKGLVSLSDGKYKLKDAKDYAQQAGQAIGSKISNSKDKIKDAAGSKKGSTEGEEKKDETAKSPSSDNEKKNNCSIC